MVYDDPGEFKSRVLEFLADGLAQGHRVCYAANRDTAVLWDDVRDLDETKRSRRPGAVQVQSLNDATGAVVEPIGLVQAYAAATQDALAAGFTCLRELGGEMIAQVACLHPAASDGSAPFRLHASARAAAFLGGELDLDLPDMRVEPSV
ncbi:MAG: MEDS domain-containing protein [Pseudonocardiaceae bacterium]